MDRGTERLEQLLALSALAISIELAIFKFLPDIGTALIQNNKSALTDFGEYQADYLVPGSVHHSRFAGNYLLYFLAEMTARVHQHGADLRLHPLRIAAGILTPVYTFLGALPVLKNGGGYSWRAFMVPYALATLMGLYTFYPGDMSSLAFLSISLFFLLRERLAWALVFMLVTGLFRESAFHCVAFVAAWSVSSRSTAVSCRVAWVAAFAGAFVAEYLLVRVYFPGPLSAAGGLIFDPAFIFMGRGLLSLTTTCSLSLAALFPISYLVKAANVRDPDWRRRFFLINSYLFPAWIVFYRMLSGNISEFRLLLPVILPCIYGLAYEAAKTGTAARALAEEHPLTP